MVASSTTYLKYQFKYMVKNISHKNCMKIYSTLQQLTVVCETIGTVISLALLTAAATAAAAAATTGFEFDTSELGSKSWNISYHQVNNNI